MFAWHLTHAHDDKSHPGDPHTNDADRQAAAAKHVLTSQQLANCVLSQSSTETLLAADQKHAVSTIPHQLDTLNFVSIHGSGTDLNVSHHLRSLLAQVSIAAV